MKKIFFSASVYNMLEMLTSYEEIIKYIKSSKSKISIDWIEEWKKLYKNERKTSSSLRKGKNVVYDAIDPDMFFENTKEILDCDAVVAEVSYPTVGVGYQLFYATSNSKPVLALYDGEIGSEKKIKSVIDVSSPLILLRKYNKKSLSNIIYNFTNKSNQKLSKFNFVITEEVKDYVTWLEGKNPKASRSALLREAICNKIISSDAEYQEYLESIS